VPYDQSDPTGFERALADAVNLVVADPAQAVAMGRAGRTRAVHEFSWAAIAGRTLEIDGALTAGR
jgi:starch synthase